MVFGIVIGIGTSVTVFFFSADAAKVANSSDEFPESNQLVDSEGDKFDLLSLIEYQSDFSRDRVLFMHLSQADIEQSVRLFKRSQELNFSSMSMKSNIQSAIVRRLTEIDPVLALNLVEAIPFSQRYLLVSQIFREWAILDLVSAIKHTSELEGWTKRVAAKSLMYARDDLSEGRRMQISSLLGFELLGVTLLSTERVEDYMETPEKAWQLIVNDDINDELQHKTLMQIAKYWVEKDGLEIFTQLLDFDASWKDHYWIAEAVIANEISNDPIRAFEYASELPPNGDWGFEISHGIRSRAVREWTKVDPIAALNAVFQIVDTSEYERAQLVSALIESWVKTDARGILSDIELIPSDAHDQVKSQAAVALMDEDRQEAIDLMKGMTNGMPKLMTAGTLVGKWGATDAYAAYDWVLSDPDIQNMRAKLLELTLQSIAQSDPSRAMELALQHLQEHSSRGEVLRLDTIVVTSVAQKDADLALSLLKQVSESSRLISYIEVAKMLVANQGYAKALSVGGDLPEKEQSGYYELIVKQWAQSAPESLFEFIRELPSRELRSQAAFSLQLNAWQGALTDRQLKQLRRFLTREDATLLKLKQTQ